MSANVLGQPTPRLRVGFVERHALRIVWGLVLTYVAFFSVVSVLRYNSFDFTDFDLAVDAQSFWAIRHGSIESSILGIPFLGNHLNLIFFPLVPLMVLFPSALTLLVFQTICLGLGAIPLALLASKWLDRPAAVLFSLLYLTYPALHYVNHYEFHSVALAVAVLLAMVYAFEQSRFGWFLCWMILALLCRENVSLGVACFGLYVRVFTHRERRWWIVPLVMGTAWALGGFLAMRHFNHATFDFGALYRYRGLEQFLAVMWSPANGTLLFQLLLPLGFVSLLAPSVLFIGLPFFLQQLLSLRPTDHLLTYHYAALLIPWLFLGALRGLARVTATPRGRERRGWLTAGLLALTLAANAGYGLLPKMPGWFATRYRKQGLDHAKQAFVERIPPDAGVVATFEFLPKLSQRRSLYSFHHVYINTYTLSAKPYRLPEDAEYALIDFTDPLTFSSFYHETGYQDLQRFLSERPWGLVEAADSLALFRKGQPSAQRLYARLPQAVPAGEALLSLGDGGIRWSYAVGRQRVAAGETIPLHFVWECVQPTRSDYWLALRITDPSGAILHEYYHPLGYRIIPTFTWKSGDVWEERVWLLVPREVRSREGVVKLLVFDRATLTPQGSVQTVPVQSNIASLIGPDGWLTLGRVEIEAGA